MRVVSSSHPDECRSASGGGNSCAKLPVRAGGPARAAYAEARAELRDRDTYYAALRSAIEAQRQQSTSTDGESGDDMAVRFGDTWT